MHVFTVALALAALSIAGCTSDEPGVTGTESGVTRQISGNWTGTLHQKGRAPFKIAVDIGADSTGRVAYTGIECGGGWTLARVASLPARYVFTEQIEKGEGGGCKGTGTVSLLPMPSYVPNEPAYSRIQYRFSGGGVTSRGVIHRTDPEHLAAVFHAAGVSLH